MSIVTYSTVLHVSLSSSSHSSFKCIFNAYKNSNARIGGDDDILQMLHDYGIDLDAQIKSQLATGLSDKGSMINGAVREVIMSETKRKITSRGARETIRIKYDLNVSNQAKLRSAYPELSIEFMTPSVRHAHAIAAAARDCETQLALKNIMYHQSMSIPRGYYVAIKDIGGNFLTHMMRGRENVHSCCPILDARDAHRFSLRVANLLSHRLSGHNLYKYNNMFSCRSTLRRLVCSNIAQECTVTAPYAIMVHSAYDMSLRDIADALDMSNNLKTIICVLFDPLILVDQEGILSDQECKWYKYRTAQGERIRFSFVNDGTLEYTITICPCT